jgi:hypothetical protein
MNENFRFQKKYLTFFFIVPLLAVTALIKVACPVCHGTGSISSTPNMLDLEIMHVTSVEQSFLTEECGMYVLYQYDVHLSIRNNGANTAQGWIELALKSIPGDQIISIRYISVEIPVNTSVDLDYPDISFETTVDSPPQAEVVASVETGEIPCKVCGGTGKVPLNTWLLDKSLAKTLQNVQISQTPYFPQNWIPATSNYANDEEGG